MFVANKQNRCPNVFRATATAFLLRMRRCGLAKAVSICAMR